MAGRSWARVRPAVVSAVLVAATVAGVATPAGAARPQRAASAGPAQAVEAQLFITLGERCVLAATSLTPAGTPATTLKLTQRRRGAVIATATMSPTTGDKLRGCVKAVRPGDRLTVKGATTRTVAVRPLTLRVDPTADTATGSLPEANASGSLIVGMSIAGVVLQRVGYGVNAGADGTFVAGSIGNVQAGDVVTLAWQGPFGDVVFLVRHLPSFVVTPGSPTVTVLGDPGSSATIKLRSDGVLLATAAVTLRGPAAKVTLRKNGAPVRVTNGDVLTTSAVPGASLKVKDPELEITTAGGGTVDARCPLGTTWLLTYAYSGSEGSMMGYLGAGTIHETGFFEPVPAGARMTLSCENTVGFGIRQTATATAPAP